MWDVMIQLPSPHILSNLMMSTDFQVAERWKRTYNPLLCETRICLLGTGQNLGNRAAPRSMCLQEWHWHDPEVVQYQRAVRLFHGHLAMVLFGRPGSRRNALHGASFAPRPSSDLRSSEDIDPLHSLRQGIRSGRFSARAPLQILLLLGRQVCWGEPCGATEVGCSYQESSWPGRWDF